MGNTGYLGNNTGMERARESEDRIGETNVYTKFGHLFDVLMGSASKVMMDELIRYIVAHYHDAC